MLTETEYWQEVQSLAESLQDYPVIEKMERLSKHHYATFYKYSFDVLRYSPNDDAFIDQGGDLSQFTNTQQLLLVLAAHAFTQDALDV